MPRRKKRPKGYRKPPLTVAQVLAWANAYHARWGCWPNKMNGYIAGTLRGENWNAVNAALKEGLRGLPGGTTLAQLLAEQRGLRHVLFLPPFTHGQILQWADAHRARTGCWPTAQSGPIPEAPGETWLAVLKALSRGRRGLAPGGSTLAQLLAEQRGTRNIGNLPPLTYRQILGWADAHFARTGLWPNVNSGPAIDAPGEVWRNVDAVLRSGGRTLPVGSSLARLLAAKRGVRNDQDLAPFTAAQILAWADAYFQRSGRWPKRDSGPIPKTDGETWACVDAALHNGCRGLTAGSSLALLLAARRGAPHQRQLPPLTTAQILAWADEHHRRTGRWPTQLSGLITQAAGQTWAGVNMALHRGQRSLPGGSSLAQLLAEQRGVRNSKGLAPFTRELILAWADAHHRRTGQWPKRNSGPIPEAAGDSWQTVDKAQYNGGRGLVGRSSLAQLLDAERGVPNRHAR